jgi:ribonucleoside-triphosphate reductase
MRRGGGLFNAWPMTGSLGVVTINLARIGYLAQDIDDFLGRLNYVMDLAKNSLLIKRKALDKLMNIGLYPYSRVQLRYLNRKYGSHWANHFLTIGNLGMNEACMNFLGEDIASLEGLKLSKTVLNHMVNRTHDYQEETEILFNVEATPAEGASHRLALLDKSKFSDIKVANPGHSAPFYTNSTHLPVDYTSDIGFALRHQEQLQPLYTGGTVFHTWLGENEPDPDGVRKLTRRLASSYQVQYFTMTPTFSICSNHGYLGGEHHKCPTCGKTCNVYSRIVGYIRPLAQWHAGKQSEFELRKTFGLEAELKSQVSDSCPSVRPRL